MMMNLIVFIYSASISVILTVLSEKNTYRVKIIKSLLHEHPSQQKRKLIQLIDSEASPPWMSIECVDNAVYQVLLLIMTSGRLRIIGAGERFSRVEVSF